MVYVELPEVGSEVKKGETFGVVESVKVSPTHLALGGRQRKAIEGCFDRDIMK